MPQCQCYYCGKIVRNKNEVNLKQSMRIHLQYCPVKTGARIQVGSQIFVVERPGRFAVLQGLLKLQKDIAPLPGEVQEGIFLGALVTEKKYGKIQNFSYSPVPSPSPVPVPEG